MVILRKLLGAILLSTFIFGGIYLYWFNKVAPEKTVQNFINARYCDVNFENIELKLKEQELLLDETLIECGYKYGDFKNTINYFKDNKYMVELLQKEIYFCKKSKGKKYYNANINIQITSKNNDKWSQDTEYLLEIVLARNGIFSNKIMYIKELDKKIKINSVHEEDYITENNDHEHNHEH